MEPVRRPHLWRSGSDPASAIVPAMTLADSAVLALGVTAVVAVLARVAGALTTSGTIAGAAVGACVSLGFGLPGLAVLGTFFVAGTLATRIGWEKKKARGTAEAGEGRRDAKRVLGKGGVAGCAALLQVVVVPGSYDTILGHSLFMLGFYDTLIEVAFVGALAAALADTLGTEIGTLSTQDPWSLPWIRRVPVGTPGAVSVSGFAGAAFGAALIACVARAASNYALAHQPHPNGEEWLTLPPASAIDVVQITIAGTGAALFESLAVGFGLRAPGFIRNVLTTAAGACIACALRVTWTGP